MYRSLPTFRRFSLRGLFFAGTLASLGLPFGQEAAGIGASAIQPTYTPRESVGATPTVSLISTGAGAPPVAEASTASSREPVVRGERPGGVRHISSDDEGAGTTAKRRRHKQASSKSTALAADRSKGADKSKEYPAATHMVAPILKPLFTISTGYETRYIYHGLDIISFNVRPDAKGNRDSGIGYTNADVSYKGFHLGLGYIESVNEVIPFLQFTNIRSGPNRGARIVDSTKHLFQEVDVDVDYTVQVVANILNATIGYNSYIFPNNDFKGTGYQSELIFRLAYTQIPHVTPSFTFFHDFSEQHNNSVGDLNGSLLEFRIDAAIPIITKPSFGLTFAPYVSSIYNIDYLKYDNTVTNPTNVGGFSVLETGIKLPLTFAHHFTVTPYGNYGLDLTSRNTTAVDNHTNNTFGERTRFWGGVTLTYSF